MAVVSPNNSIRNSSQFFQIQKLQVNNEKNHRLCDVFNAINNLSTLTINKDSIKNILNEDLQIPTLNVQQPLLNVLEEAVLHYCKTWEGWDKPVGFYKTIFDIQIAQVELKMFVAKKCNFIVQHAEKYIQQLKKDVLDRSKKSTDSNLVCPYKIIIGGSPSILNNMVVFMRNDDIVIKQYQDMVKSIGGTPEFLNWPFVSVEVKLLDLHIKRTNCTSFKRYISKANQKLPPLSKDFTSDVKKLADNGKPYTHSFFCFYFNQLFNVLQNMKVVEPSRIKELQAIYTQFLDDVKEMNIARASMRTYTSIKFHIGKQNYARSKQMLVGNKQGNNDDIAGVNFIEYVTPQVDLSLFYCTAMQDMDDVTSVTFRRLNNINKRALLTTDQDILNLAFIVNNTCIEYSCTFCSTKFYGSQALKEAMAHFSQQHKAGHALVCTKCHKQHSIHTLAENRWKHVCV